MSELGMALLVKSEPAALLTDFEGDAARHPSATPVKEAHQRNAADVVAHAPIAMRSPGYPDYASLYSAQAHNARSQGAADDEEAGTARECASNDMPRGERTGASYTNPSAAPDFAAYGLTPQTARVDPRGERLHERERRRREPEQREEIESQEKPGYTIDDIVQFAGVTVAERRMPPANLASTGYPKHH